MKRIFTTLTIVAALTIFAVGCRQTNSKSAREDERNSISSHSDSLINSIYHWKTTFAPDAEEWEFLSRHNISRMYVRMFDVAVERNYERDEWDVVPIATTKFESIDSKKMGNIEIIPTTYITINALREMKGKEVHYAELIVERLRAMANFNKLGRIREMQFDCDWTSTTREIYFELCRVARRLLQEDSIALSSTIRLHQLFEMEPPVDRGVLMLYNTGNLKRAETGNSILDIKDAEPYLRRAVTYSVPLDYAYPTYGWGVKFYAGGKFQAIVSDPATEKLEDGETMRVERPTVADILAVKKLVEKQLGRPAAGNIIYHFDKDQLKYYTDDEIDEIFSVN